MNYFVVNRGDEKSQQISNRFNEIAQKIGLKYDENEPDLVLTIGGDGTLLQAFHQFEDRLQTVGFVGVHTGHLGFYADWDPDQIEELAYLIQKENIEEKVVQYPLVEIELETSTDRHHWFALNECTLKGIDHTMVAEIKLNDELFVSFRGDGICISTPSGSTAYNKSLGGAIIHPSFDGIQIAEIASINNRVYRSLGSSYLLPEHHHCDILPRKHQNLLVTIDQLSMTHREILSLRCKVATQKIRFVRYRPFTFWNRVREAFIDDNRR
jgi:NAD+ kinase